LADTSIPSLASELWSGETVVWSAGPDPRGEMIARARYASQQAYEALQECLTTNAAGVILSPFIAGFVWLRHARQRRILYAITTRRVITLHGSDLNWRAVRHCVSPKVLWRKGEIGSVLFSHDPPPEPDLRFDGVRDPDGVIAIVLKTAGLPSTRDPYVLN
jgi:hypothetical protein